MSRPTACEHSNHPIVVSECDLSDVCPCDLEFHELADLDQNVALVRHPHARAGGTQNHQTIPQRRDLQTL